MTPKEQSQLTFYFQRRHNASVTIQCAPGGSERLTEDGTFGPLTAKELSRYDIGTAPAGIFEMAWGFATIDIGRGGDGKRNNQGEYIRLIRQVTQLVQLGMGAWCAVDVSYWLVLSDEEFGNAVKHRSATRLSDRLMEIGAVDVDPSHMGVGQVAVALYRSGGQNRGRHTRLIKRIDANNFEGIGGNERGDKVRHTYYTEQSVDRNLVRMLVLPQEGII